MVARKEYEKKDAIKNENMYVATNESSQNTNMIIRPVWGYMNAEAMVVNMAEIVKNMKKDIHQDQPMAAWQIQTSAVFQSVKPIVSFIYQYRWNLPL